MRSDACSIWRRGTLRASKPAAVEEALAPAFDPSERKKYQPDAPGPSEPEEAFPDSADMVAIAEVQQAAAESGVPFCKECARNQGRG